MTPIDLSQLPAPTVIDPLDYEQLLAERKDRLIELTDADEREALRETLKLESEPLTKLLQENAYRELVLRQRVNDAAKAVMVAYAEEGDLENLSALFDVQRLEGETDNELRARTVMALEGLPTAGPAAAYEFHARSANPDVKDIGVSSPAPGQVALSVLSKKGAGEPDDTVLEDVREAVNDERVRPLTDTVRVAAAEITEYRIEATLFVEPGPSAETVKRAAESAAKEYTEKCHRLGGYVARSGIAAALHQPGVRRIDLVQPVADIDMPASGAAYVERIKVGAEVTV